MFFFSQNKTLSENITYTAKDIQPYVYYVYTPPFCVVFRHFEMIDTVQVQTINNEQPTKSRQSGN